MTGYTRAPRILKGALAVYDSPDSGDEPTIIAFQYNPESVRRTLRGRAPAPDPAGGAKREDVSRVVGPPVETLTLSISLDASDALGEPIYDPIVAASGLHSPLAQREMLLYPPSARVRENERLADEGELQLVPEELPLTLLVWGPARVVPVRVTGLAIHEEAYDPHLNPIRAQLDLSLQVLTYLELKESSRGRDVYLAYQRSKEELAAIGRGRSVRVAAEGFLPELG
ncbi:MAG: hypothetical protein ABL998_08310 [Planctomycetota bacterium]